MLGKKRIYELVWDAMVAGLWAVIGPFLIKLAVFSDDAKLHGWFEDHGFWMVYPFDILMVLAMLTTNTISVKYKMLSFKINGAFMGYTLIFIFQWMFAIPLDYIIEGKFPHWHQFVGAPLVVSGICLVCYDYEKYKDEKRDKEGDQGYKEVKEDEKYSEHTQKKEEEKKFEKSNPSIDLKADEV